MYRYHAKYLLVLLAIVSGTHAWSQTSTISNPLSGREIAPYSIFGIGEMLDGNNAVLRGMGDVSGAYQNPYNVNTDNPASYSSLALTTYEVGATASLRSLATSTTTYGTGTATLSYINIGIPLGKNGGMTFGFKPMTHVFYVINDTTGPSNITPIGQAAYSHTGIGGVNYAFIGGAYKYKGLSIGANFGYLFGSIEKTSGVVNLDTTSNGGLAYNSVFADYTKVGGIYWKGGIMYEKKLKKDMGFRVGGTITLSQHINTTFDQYWIGYYRFSDTTVQDTANTNSQKKGFITLPLMYNIGFHFFKTDRWDVGIDYSAGNWSQFRSNGLIDSASSGSLVNNYKIALGGEITPDPTNTRNYFSRVTYRLGLYYGTSFVNVYNNTLPYYGVTFGASLPFKRSFSHMQASFDIGRLGNTNSYPTPTGSNNVIQETYIRFTLGVSFADRWFQRRKEL